MTPSNPKPPSDLSDAELVEAVATEAMGWKKNITGSSWISGKGKIIGDKVHAATFGWNPLENWNHTMDVVEKVLDICLSCEIIIDRFGGVAAFMSSNCRKIENDNPRRAILEAALTAVRS